MSWKKMAEDRREEWQWETEKTMDWAGIFRESFRSTEIRFLMLKSFPFGGLSDVWRTEDAFYYRLVDYSILNRKTNSTGFLIVRWNQISCVSPFYVENLSDSSNFISTVLPDLGRSPTADEIFKENGEKEMKGGRSENLKPEQIKENFWNWTIRDSCKFEGSTFIELFCQRTDRGKKLRLTPTINSSARFSVSVGQAEVVGVVGVIKTWSASRQCKYSKRLFWERNLAIGNWQISLSLFSFP